MTLGEYIGAGSGLTKLLLHLNGNSNDSSGNSNNGADTAITYSQANGKFGQGAGFNGSTSKITAPNASVPTTDITVSLWTKHNGNYGGANLAEALLSKLNGATWKEGFDLYGFNASPNSVKIEFWTTEYTNIGSVTIPCLTDNNWHNIIFTYNNSTKLLSLFVDGSNQGVSNTTTLSTSPTYSTNVLDIGSSGQTYLSKYNGSIDEILIENTVWSVEKVKKYYTNSKGRFGII